jgi:hypothetical protein
MMDEIAEERRMSSQRNKIKQLPASSSSKSKSSLVMPDELQDFADQLNELDDVMEEYPEGKDDRVATIRKN